MLFGKRREKGGRWPRFGSEINITCFQCLTGGTQPRAERRGVSGSLVMGMMRGVGDHLWVDHAAEDQQADREARGEHVANWPKHDYGSDADREVLCISRSTT
jgi:hypothetical protein